MTKQCRSCGGFCGKVCQRENVAKRKNEPHELLLRRVMARLADLLDEDQFAGIESIVTSAGVSPPQPKEPEQEPVAWHLYFGNEDEPNYVCLGEKPTEKMAVIRPLVFGDTTPPQRTWVGLTAEQIASVPLNEHTLQTVEKLLKENNK